MAKNVPKVTLFEWNDQRREAAILLSQGHLIKEVAKAVDVSEKTIDRWKRDIDFSTEVDRLSLMLDIASRAERLRIAKRVVREKTEGKTVKTCKDVLLWLQFAQSETDGAKKLVEIDGKLNVENLEEVLSKVYGSSNDQSG